MMPVQLIDAIVKKGAYTPKLFVMIRVSAPKIVVNQILVVCSLLKFVMIMILARMIHAALLQDVYMYLKFVTIMISVPTTLVMKKLEYVTMYLDAVMIRMLVPRKNANHLRVFAYTIL
jgi:hypothetical protein